MAFVTSDHGPFSPRVLTQRSMETAVFPRAPFGKLAVTLGLIAFVRNAGVAGLVGAAPAAPDAHRVSARARSRSPIVPESGTPPG